MDNILLKYIESKGLRQSEFARIIDCNPSLVYSWCKKKVMPQKVYAWKIHKATKGAVPITYWGYTMSRGRIKKIQEADGD